MLNILLKRIRSKIMNSLIIVKFPCRILNCDFVFWTLRLLFKQSTRWRSAMSIWKMSRTYIVISFAFVICDLHFICPNLVYNYFRKFRLLIFNFRFYFELIICTQGYSWIWFKDSIFIPLLLYFLFFHFPGRFSSHFPHLVPTWLLKVNFCKAYSKLNQKGDIPITIKSVNARMAISLACSIRRTRGTFLEQDDIMTPPLKSMQG